LQEDGTIEVEKNRATIVPESYDEPFTQAQKPAAEQNNQILKIYYLGITRRFIAASAANLGIEVNFVDSPDDADIILALKKVYKKRSPKILKAETQGIPLYVVKEDNRTQVENTLLNVAQYFLSSSP
jgi:hypothetical protein